MALIDLPNSAQWDDTLDMSGQTEEALEWFNSILEGGENVSLQEKEFCGNNLQGNPVHRITKSVYEDSPNNLQIEYTREYVYPANNRKSGAVKRHSYTVKQV